MSEKVKQVIFICTGNFYRSRLAEELFNYYVGETNLPWEATSRGMVDSSFGGISPVAFEYLKKRGLSPRIDPTRDSIPLKVSDIEKAELLIAMNQEEHEPMLREKFGQIPRILAQRNRLRYWNVCDVPGETNSLSQFFGERRPTQSPRSGTEHIDFAVRALLQELKQKMAANTVR